MIRAETAKLPLPEFQLRKEDADECLAYGFSTQEGVNQCVENSTESFVLYWGAEPMLAWGYRADAVYTGACDVWLLTTGLVVSHKKDFVRAAIKAHRALQEVFHLQRVVVAVSYTKAIRWLKSLGFIEVAWTKPGMLIMICGGV